jgi:hypothetical protein
MLGMVSFKVFISKLISNVKSGIHLHYNTNHHDEWGNY